MALVDHLVVLVVCSVTFLNVFLSGALTVAAPVIAKQLHFKQADIQWPLNAFALSYGCALLLFGKVADIVGSRLMFLVGSGWVFAWALATSFAPNSQTFITFVALQGLGAAANTPAGISILSAYFPPGRAKNRAFSLLGAGQPVGFIVGLIGGSLLMQVKNENGRRGIFWIEAFLALFMLVLGFCVLPRDKTSFSRKTQLDWVGAILSTAGLALLTYILAESTSTSRGWGTPYVPALFVVSLVLLAAFVCYELRFERHPSIQVLLPPSIFLQPKARLGPVMLLVFFGWWNFNTMSYLMTLYYQQVLVLDPLQTAVRFLPLTIAAFVYLVVTGRVMDRIPGQWLILLGLSGNVAATIIFSLIDVSSSYWAMAFLVMLFIPGADIAYTVINLHICSAFDKNSQGLAGSVFVVATRLGTSIGLAVTQSVATAVSKNFENSHSSTSPTDPTVIMAGLRAGGWTCLGAVGLSICIGAVFLRGLGIVGQTEDNNDEQPEIEQVQEVPVIQYDVNEKDPIEIGELGSSKVNGSTLLGSESV